MRPATPSDIEALVVSVNAQSESIRQEFSRGTDVWVVEQAGKLVAYDVCGAESKTLADFIRLEAPERDTWAIGIWVAPEARGQGLAVQLRRRVAQEFRNRGLTHLLGTISATNKRSIRTFKKIGAKFVGRVDYAWFYGLGVVWFDGRLRVGRWTKRRPLTLAM